MFLTSKNTGLAFVISVRFYSTFMNEYLRLKCFLNLEAWGLHVVFETFDKYTSICMIGMGCNVIFVHCPSRQGRSCLEFTIN